MFSRSEKTDEVIDPMAEPSAQRSPMVMAALAGLLAVAGAFLLVWYVNNGQDGSAAADSSGEATSAVAEANRQVLVVVETIPRGTSVSELLEAPTVYLSARAVPEQFVAASAITSVAELEELVGQILSSDALPGEQLLRGRFRDPSDFDSNTETFFETESLVDIPAGHHAVVLELPASRALGGNIGIGDKVTVVASFRLSPPGAESFEISVVALNAIEVLGIQNTLEVQGQLSDNFNQVGAANRGSYTLTVAVTPEELTDLTYAMSYGDITLATAVKGLTNEDGPRAITGTNQIIGDDGVWLAELDDGNLVDIIGLFPIAAPAEGQSIELELPDEDVAEPEAADSAEEDSDVSAPVADTEDDVDAGDS
jgi:Flp pilus assembly protein CpaB